MIEFFFKKKIIATKYNCNDDKNNGNKNNKIKQYKNNDG